MKSLISEEEKLRIRYMHINKKNSLLKEDNNPNGFAGLLPIPSGAPVNTDINTNTVGTCTGAPELKTLEDEGKFRTWVKTTYANNLVSGIKLSDKRWKNPPTVFCNKALSKLWKSIEPVSQKTYGQLYLQQIIK